MTASGWRRWSGIPWVLCIGIGAVGCVGKIGDPVGGPGSEPLSCDGAAISPGDAPIRRMTHFEYNNTVHDLLGDTTSPADTFPPDEVSGGFNNQASALVVNIGTLSSFWVTAMRSSAAAARETNKPWVLDPVGCGATAYRTEVARDLASMEPTLIRANAPTK